MVIYPVDSAIQLLNNRDLVFIQAMVSNSECDKVGKRPLLVTGANKDRQTTTKLLNAVRNC